MSGEGETPGVTPASAAALCDAYLQGLVEGDLDAVVSLFSSDATVEDPVGSEIKQGEGELRAFYQIACDSVTAAERTGPPRIAGQDIAFAFTLQWVWPPMPCVSTSLMSLLVTERARCAVCAPTGGLTICARMTASGVKPGLPSPCR